MVEDAETVREILVEMDSRRPIMVVGFFFSSRRRHTRSYGDWSSDVCSSDLPRLSKREKRAAQEKIGEGVAGGRARAGKGVAAERKYALAEVLDQIEEPQAARSEERRVGKEGRW